MYRVMRKAVLAGLGARVVIKRVVDDLVNKGEADHGPEAVRLRELVSGCEQSARKVETAVKEGVNALARTVRVPSRSDVEALERKIKDLAQKIDALSRRP